MAKHGITKPAIRHHGTRRHPEFTTTNRKLAEAAIRQAGGGTIRGQHIFAVTVPATQGFVNLPAAVEINGVLTQRFRLLSAACGSSRDVPLWELVPLEDRQAKADRKPEVAS